RTHDHPSRSERLLRRALTANAAFSATCAAVCLAGATALAGWLGVAAADLRSLGVELAVFAVGLFVLQSRNLRARWARRTVAAVIALDALWVVGSAALLLAPNPLTTAGQWTVVAVAAVVGDLAFFQWRGWRGMARERATAEALVATEAPLAAAATR
ncbi:MAG: hypothetical protein AAGE94_08565, partial [Acidobacteriota bacterium]